METPEDKPIEKTKPPETAVDDYMDNRNQRKYCKDSYEYYKCLMESIAIGNAILGCNGNELSKEIKKALGNPSNFLAKRNMNYDPDTGTYSCSTGSSETGTIYVRREEIKDGIHEVMAQQAERVIESLKLLDSKIYEELLKEGWIQTQSPCAKLIRLLD